MNRTATLQPRMNDEPPTVDPRRRYEDALIRAMRFAERHLPRDQALEIAHDVASEMLDLPPARVTGTLIYIAVTSRIRSHWRSKQRRSALEGAYHEMWANTSHAWAEPGAEMEVRELQARIESALATMPAGMRTVFSLINQEELSYKDAAARLGVSVGTIHTQLCRANALLRHAVAEYHADVPGAKQSRRTR